MASDTRRDRKKRAIADAASDAMTTCAAPNDTALGCAGPYARRCAIAHNRATCRNASGEGLGPHAAGLTVAACRHKILRRNGARPEA